MKLGRVVVHSRPELVDALVVLDKAATGEHVHIIRLTRRDGSVVVGAIAVASPEFVAITAPSQLGPVEVEFGDIATVEMQAVHWSRLVVAAVLGMAITGAVFIGLSRVPVIVALSRVPVFGRDSLFSTAALIVIAGAAVYPYQRYISPRLQGLIAPWRTIFKAL